MEKHIYAMQSPSGRVIKVGYTNKPLVRCRRLRTRNGAEEVGDWKILHTRQCRNFLDAEQIAHDLLWPPKYKREYFATTADNAIRAVDAGVELADA